MWNGLRCGVETRLYLTSEEKCQDFCWPLFHKRASSQETRGDGFWFVGTIRANRMKNCPPMSEKDLKKMGRGSSDYRVKRTTNILAIRWYDNKTVNLLSTLAGVEPADTARRYDRSTKKHWGAASKCCQSLLAYQKPAMVHTCIYMAHNGSCECLVTVSAASKETVWCNKNDATQAVPGSNHMLRSVSWQAGAWLTDTIITTKSEKEGPESTSWWCPKRRSWPPACLRGKTTKVCSVPWASSTLLCEMSKMQCVAVPE